MVKAVLGERSSEDGRRRGALQHFSRRKFALNALPWATICIFFTKPRTQRRFRVCFFGSAATPARQVLLLCVASKSHRRARRRSVRSHARSTTE